MTLGNDHPLAAAFVDLKLRYVLLNDGERLPITNLIDDDGEECEPDDAVFVVAGEDGKGWWTVDIRDLVEVGQLN